MVLHVVIVTFLLQACFGQQLQQPQQQPQQPPQQQPQQQQVSQGLPPDQAATFNSQTGQLMDLFRGATASFSQALVNLINYKLRWLSQVAANVPGGQGDVVATTFPIVPGALSNLVIQSNPPVSPQAPLYQQPQPVVPQAPMTAPAIPAPSAMAPNLFPAPSDPATGPQVAYPPNLQAPPPAQQTALSPPQTGYQNPTPVSTLSNPLPPAQFAPAVTNPSMANPAAPAFQPALPLGP